MIDVSKAIEMYEKQFMSTSMIATQFGVSRQRVWKLLRRYGANTSKRKADVVCDNCGEIFKKHRCQIRQRMHNFCSSKCYFSYIRNPEYNQHRQGQRIAKQVFEAEVGFTFDWTMHHVDSNDDNNIISNLWAFKDQSSHMCYHRGGKATALIGETKKWTEVQMPM